MYIIRRASNKGPIAKSTNFLAACKWCVKNLPDLSFAVEIVEFELKGKAKQLVEVEVCATYEVTS